jgi:hypothetical protein
MVLYLSSLNRKMDPEMTQDVNKGQTDKVGSEVRGPVDMKFHCVVDFFVHTKKKGLS